MDHNRADLEDSPQPSRRKRKEFVAGVALTILAIAVNAVLPFRLELGYRVLISVSLLFALAISWLTYSRRRWSRALIKGSLWGGLFAFLWTALFSVPGLTDLLWEHLKDLNSWWSIAVYVACWFVAICVGPAVVFVVASWLRPLDIAHSDA